VRGGRTTPSIALRGLQAYGAFVTRSPRRVVAGVLIATTVMAIGATRLSVEVDPDDQLPQSHPYIQTFHRIHQLFGDWNLAIIGLEPVDGTILSGPFLRTVQAITSEISRLPGVNPALLQSIAAPTAKIAAVDAEGFRAEPVMASVPTSQRDLEELSARLRDNRAFVGTIASADQRAVAIYATFELTPELPGYVDIHRAIDRILVQHRDSSFRTYVSGPIPMVASISTYSSSVIYYLPLALIVIGLIHYHTFRMTQALFLPIITGLLAVIWALGIMGFCDVRIDPLNSTTPILILAIGAGHAVQILARYYEEVRRSGDGQSAVWSTYGGVGVATLAAGGIAALSFFSLAIFGTRSVQSFGLFTGLGVLAVVFIELTLIPAIRAMYPPQKIAKGPADSGFLRSAMILIGILVTSRRGPAIILGVYAGCLAVSAYFASTVVVDTSFKRSFSADDSIRIADDKLNDLFAGTNSLLFLIEGSAEGAIADPRVILALSTLQGRVEQLPGVGKALSVADVLFQMHRALSPGSSSLLPPTKELTVQYMFLYGLSGGNDLEVWITPDYRAAKILVLLREDSTRYARALIHEVERIAGEVLPSHLKLSVAGSLASTSALTDTIVRGKIINVLQVAGATIAIASCVLGSIFGGLCVAIPLIFAVLVNLGVMGALGVPLDVSTAPITAMVVGIGADYGVYFLSRLREEFQKRGEIDMAIRESLLTSGQAVLLVSSAVGLGYSVLCLSGFRLFVQLGALFASAMATASLATILVIPALYRVAARPGVPEKGLAMSIRGVKSGGAEMRHARNPTASQRRATKTGKQRRLRLIAFTEPFRRCAVAVSPPRRHR
jgi:predicted RND superfamily exporter protein